MTQETVILGKIFVLVSGGTILFFIQSSKLVYIQW